MRGRTNAVVVGGGSDEWKELPAAAQTRAPSYEYYPFSITFDDVPEGIIIKGHDGGTVQPNYMGYAIAINRNFGGASIINASLSGNTLTGTLQHTILEFRAPFYYKTF